MGCHENTEKNTYFFKTLLNDHTNTCHIWCQQERMIEDNLFVTEGISQQDRDSHTSLKKQDFQARLQ